MRIVATADVHIDLTDQIPAGEMDRLVDGIHEARPDVLIVAGDLVGLGKQAIGPTLDRLRVDGAHNLIVPGNHDLWLPEGDSRAYYEQELPGIYSRAGFHMLDAGPSMVGRVAFVGNVAWYDYSFADPDLPPTRQRSYERKRWEGVATWNDGIFVRLGMSDPEFCSLLNQRLRDQLAGLPAEVQTVVAVTHHVGYDEMVLRKAEPPGWNFCAAFLGSRALGELLAADPRVRYHLCGHTHTASTVTRGGLCAVNIGSTYRRKRIEVIELDAG